MGHRNSVLVREGSRSDAWVMFLEITVAALALRVCFISEPLGLLVLLSFIAMESTVFLPALAIAAD